MAVRDPKKPVHIDLENDDSVDLIPWEFVIDKLNTYVGAQIIPKLRSINSDLTRIERKLKEWAEDQE